MSRFEVYPDGAGLARAAAAHFVELAAQAIEARGRFAVALSGGSTPRATYSLLASAEFAPRPSTLLRPGVDWSRIHVFWGDERCVPPDHPDSNYAMAREVLLDQVPSPRHNVHRIRAELPPPQAAALYQRKLEAVLGTEGRFDLILLGMGADGHTASLFPGTAGVGGENALGDGELCRIARLLARHTDPAGAQRCPPGVPSLGYGRGGSVRLDPELCSELGCACRAESIGEGTHCLTAWERECTICRRKFIVCLQVRIGRSPFYHKMGK